MCTSMLQNIIQPWKRRRLVWVETSLFPLPCAFFPRPLPLPCSKDTHHYGTNHGAFDHPPQSRVVIHIPTAERQTGRRNRDYARGLRCVWGNVPGPRALLRLHVEGQLGRERGGAAVRACFFSAVVFPSISLLRQGQVPKSQGHQGVPGQRPHSPLRSRALGGAISPWTFFLPP